MADKHYKSVAVKRLRAEVAAKHYRELQTFIDLANLLPTKVVNGNLSYVVGDLEIAENDLPDLAALCGVLPAGGSRSAPVIDARTASSAVMLREFKSRRNPELIVEHKSDDGARCRIGPKHPSANALLAAVYKRFQRRFQKDQIVLSAGTFSYVPTTTLNSQLYAYELFTVYARALRELTRISTSRRENRPGCVFAMTIPEHRIYLHAGPKVRRLDLDLFHHGFLPTVLAQDAQRFAWCPVCGRFYVAWRIDKSACSLKCLNVLRVRRHRAKRHAAE